MGKSLRLSGRILLRTCAAHRVVAATGAGVQNFESIVGTMPNDLRIRLIGLIVRDDVQGKARLRYAVVDNLLLNVAFHALAGVRGRKKSG